jgi:branched-chain amino acid transport system permease protein
MDALTLVVAGLANGSLYALVALGLVLIYKTQDVVNFAHGEILMVGAFIGYTIFQILGWSYPLALIAAVLLCGVLGALIERIAFRRLAHEHHITLAMVTVGLSFTLKGAARLPFGGDIYTFPPLFRDTPPIVVGTAVISPQSPRDDQRRRGAHAVAMVLLPLDDDGQANARHAAEPSRRATRRH